MQTPNEINNPPLPARQTTATSTVLSALGGLYAREGSLTTPVHLDDLPLAPVLTPAEWEKVEQLAMEERVAPLLYWAWRGQNDPPPAILSQLHQSYLLTAISNTLRFEELQVALHALSAAGVQTIVLKGAALAVTVYADPALRPMVDVDLLLHREDMSRALAIFEAQGYVMTGAEVHTGATLAYENEIALVKPGSAPALLPQIMVELHWSLLDSPFHQRSLDMGWFWATARPLEIEGEPTLMLGAEAQLLHLCAHLWLHHRGEGLLWLHDIATVIHRDREIIEWEQLLLRANDFHMVLPLQQTLPLVAETWGAPVPAAVLRRLQAMTASPAERRVFQWLTAGSRPPAQRFWADLWGQPGWGRRAAFAMRQLFPTPAYMRQRYRIESKWALPFLYPYRWLLGLMGAISMKSTPHE